MASRSAQIRDHVRHLQRTHGCDFEADYRDDNRKWELSWADGPTAATVRASIDRQLPEHKDIIYTARRYSDEALVLGAIRLFTSGEAFNYHSWAWEFSAAELLRDIPDPISTATPRELAMVQRALDASEETNRYGHRYRGGDQAISMMKDRGGIGWLLAPEATAPDGRQPEADGSLPGPLTLTPIEVLTARYAKGQQGQVWRSRAEPMPADQAFAAAVADDEIDADGALAALGLVAGLRAELDAQEAAIIARARAQGASWSDVGRVLGMAKQSAQKRYGVLSERAAAKPSTAG